MEHIEVVISPEKKVQCIKSTDALKVRCVRTVEFTILQTNVLLAQLAVQHLTNSADSDPDWKLGQHRGIVGVYAARTGALDRSL